MLKKIPATCLPFLVCYVLATVAALVYHQWTMAGFLAVLAAWGTWARSHLNDGNPCRGTGWIGFGVNILIGVGVVLAMLWHPAKDTTPRAVEHIYAFCFGICWFGDALMSLVPKPEVLFSETTIWTGKMIGFDPPRRRVAKTYFSRLSSSTIGMTLYTEEMSEDESSLWELALARGGVLDISMTWGWHGIGLQQWPSTNLNRLSLGPLMVEWTW